MISDYPIKILPDSFALYTFWQTIGIHDYNNYNVHYRKIKRYILSCTMICIIRFICFKC